MGSLGTVVCGIGAALACMAERDAAAAGPHVDESQGRGWLCGVKDIMVFLQNSLVNAINYTEGDT